MTFGRGQSKQIAVTLGVIILGTRISIVVQSVGAPAEFFEKGNCRAAVLRRLRLHVNGFDDAFLKERERAFEGEDFVSFHVQNPEVDVAGLHAPLIGKRGDWDGFSEVLAYEALGTLECGLRQFCRGFLFSQAGANEARRNVSVELEAKLQPVGGFVVWLEGEDVFE